MTFYTCCGVYPGNVFVRVAEDGWRNKRRNLQKLLRHFVILASYATSDFIVK